MQRLKSFVRFLKAVSNQVFKLLKTYLPGPFTFILECK